MVLVQHCLSDGVSIFVGERYPSSIGSFGVGGLDILFTVLRSLERYCVYDYHWVLEYNLIHNKVLQTSRVEGFARCADNHISRD